MTDKLQQYAQEMAKELKLKSIPKVVFSPFGAIALYPKKGRPVIGFYKGTPQEIAHEMGHIYLFSRHPYLTETADILYKIRPVLTISGLSAPLVALAIAEKLKPLKALGYGILGALGGYTIGTIPKLTEEIAATRIGESALRRIEPEVDIPVNEELKYILSYAKPHF
jgi:hypothetical protein